MLTRALALTASLALLAQSALADEDLVEKSSPHDVATTVDRLAAAVEAAGAKVVARVDHAAAATGAGLELGPVTMLMFGNPKLGTPLMRENPAVGLDLPLRVVVWQDEDGKTRLAYHELEEMLEDYDIDDDLEAVEQIEDALDTLTDKAVAEE